MSTSVKMKVFVVSNPDASDSESEESPSLNPNVPYPYYPNIPPPPPLPCQQSPPNIVTHLPSHSGTHSSNPALSSPSSTSSRAVESTPPPTTPSQTTPPADLSSEDPSSPEPLSGPSSGGYSAARGEPLPHLVHKPPPGRSVPQISPRFNPVLPTSATSAADPASNSSPASSSSDKIVKILISTDSEKYQIVDISGLRDAAFVKERIFTKLGIYDEVDQAHFSIYLTQIAEFAIGDALTDDQLFEICRDHGDNKGTLKFFVSHSSAPVHELSPASTQPLISIQTIPPPVLPSNSITTYPIRPAHHRPPSVEQTPSPISESLLVDVPKGYEADVDNSNERDKPAGLEKPTKVVRPLPQVTPNPPPPSPHECRFPSAPSPSSHTSPSSQPSRSGVTIPNLASRPQVQAPVPPPLSPNRTNFSLQDDATNGTHIRTQSGTLLSAAPRTDSREHLRRPTRPSNDTDGDWVHVAHVRDTSRTNEREQPRTPQDGGRSPPGAQRGVRESPRDRRYKLPIPKPPRNPPPAVPVATVAVEVPPPRRLVLPGQPVPVNWLQTSRFASKTDKAPTNWSSGDSKKTMREARSMDNLNLRAQMNASNYGNGHPPMLQPGAGGRSRAPVLPVAGGTGLGQGTLITSDRRDMSSPMGQNKSSDGGRSPYRHPPTRTGNGYGGTDIHAPYSTSRTNSSLMSPSNDPHARPQSALSEFPDYLPKSMRSPTVYDMSQDSDSARSPFSPSQQPTNSLSGTLLPMKADQANDLPRFNRYPSSPRNAREDNLSDSVESELLGQDYPWIMKALNTSTNEGTVVPSRSSSSAEQTIISTNFIGTSISSMTSDTYDSDSETGTSGTWKVPFKPGDGKIPRPPSICKPTLKVNTGTSSSPEKHPTFMARDSTLPLRIANRPPRSSRNSSKAFNRPASKFTERIDETWAPRPPPEDVYDNLEEFFPLHDLDKPVLEANSGSTSPINGEVIPTPSRHPVDNYKERSRVKGKKSIRIVAEEHKKKYRESHGDTSSISNSSMLRKRSTKLWGSKLEEVTTANAKNVPPLPDSPGDGAKESFKWVRGELIGRGTYGRVYLAMNATTGEMIAVKQVEIPRTASDKSDSRQILVVEALKSESETLKDLDHPNIVQYLGFEETPQNLSIFLEYVPGGSIGSCLLKHGKFDEEVTKSFTAQILDGLDYLHSKGILHRDMKADNILVETSGICKISDFGISKRTDDSAHTAMQGTVFWMAPEVIRAKEKGYTFKIDIWSIGCVVLEMWAGVRPWQGNEQVAVVLKLFQELRPPIPEDLKLSQLADDFRLQCFAIDPEQRPSAAELRKHPYLELPPGWIFTGFK